MINNDFNLLAAIQIVLVSFHFTLFLTLLVFFFFFDFFFQDIFANHMSTYPPDLK